MRDGAPSSVGPVGSFASGGFRSPFPTHHVMADRIDNANWAFFRRAMPKKEPGRHGKNRKRAVTSPSKSLHGGMVRSHEKADQAAHTSFALSLLVFFCRSSSSQKGVQRGKSKTMLCGEERTTHCSAHLASCAKSTSGSPCRGNGSVAQHTEDGVNDRSIVNVIVTQRARVL